MNTGITSRSLFDDVEYELQQIRKFVYVATCALTSEDRNYVASDVAHMLDQVVAVRVSNLLDDIKERRAPPQGPPILRARYPSLTHPDARPC